MKKPEYFLSLVMVLLLFMVLGCDSGSSAGDGVTTYTFYSADANPNWADMKDECGLYLTEKTGVYLQAEFSYGNSEDRIALMAASGDYPDLIYAKGDSAALIEVGALLDLTDLIDKYAPNIKKVAGEQFGRMRYSEDDHSIYFVPNLEMVNQNYFEAGGYFFLQLDLLQQQNYPKILTLSDYEKAIETYYKANPVINGQPAIPLSLIADDWMVMISITNPAWSASGTSDDGEYYIDLNTGKAMVHYKRPIEREYFRWLNHMNTIGLLDKESFVQKRDQYLNKITQGRVIGIIDRDWDVGSAVAYLKSLGMYERAYAPFPVTLGKDKYEAAGFTRAQLAAEGTEFYDDGEIKNADFQRTGFNGGWGGAISTKCKDPVKLIKFLDYLASDEGQVFVSWGLEGKHYNVVDGKRVIPPEIMDRKNNDATAFQRESGVGSYAMSIRYGDGNLDPSGNYYTTKFPDYNWDARSELEQKILTSYGYRNWKDAFPREDEFPVKPWGAAWTIPIPNDSELAPFSSKEQNVVAKWIPEAILSSPEEFDAVYDRFLAELEKIDATKMEGLYTQIIEKRIRFWK